LAQPRNGLAAVRPAASQRKALRRALQSKLIRYLLVVGSLAAKDRRELAEQFRLPDDSASHEAFLNGVKGLLEKAGAQKDLLVSMGMSHTLPDDLGAWLSEFETTLQSSRTARDHVGASGDLMVMITAIGDQVRVLDGLVRYRFGDNAELMSAWRSARTIVNSVRSSDKGDEIEPPQPGGGIAPAA
jgi:hypothetical protein